MNLMMRNLRWWLMLLLLLTAAAGLGTTAQAQDGEQTGDPDQWLTVTPEGQATAEVTPEPVTTPEPDQPDDDLTDGVLTFATVALLVMAAFGVVLLMTFVVVIAPLLAKALPAELAGIVVAGRDAALGVGDDVLRRLQAEAEKNDVTWDDELIQHLIDYINAEKGKNAPGVTGGAGYVGGDELRF